MDHDTGRGRLGLILRGGGLNRADAGWFITVLATVAGRPPYANAVDAIVDAANRCDDGEVRALCDWWAVCAAGRKSTGEAYRLPEWLGSLRERMLVLLRQKDPPGLEWLAAQRRLTKAVAELDDSISLDKYGVSKLPHERDVWDFFISQVGSTIEALRSSRPAEKPSVDTRQIEKRMQDYNIHAKSPRWNEMLDRVREATRFLDAAVQDQHLARPWKDADAPATGPTPDTVPPELREAVVAIASALVDDAPPLTTAAALEVLGLEAAGGSPSELAALTRVAYRLLAEHGVPEPLGDTFDRYEAILGSVEALKGRDIDTTGIEVGLLNDDFDAAEAAGAGLEAEVLRARKEQTLAAMLERLGQVVGPDGDGELLGLLGDARSALAGGQFEEADRMLEEVRERSAAAVRHARLTEYDKLIATLRTADPSTPALQYAVDRAGQLHADAMLQLRQKEIDDLCDLVDQTEQRTRGRVEDLLSQIDVALTDEKLADDARDEGRPERTRIAQLADRSALADAVTAAEELLDRLARRRLRWWRAEEGEEALVEHVVTFIGARTDIHRDDILRLHVALKARPFVILAGITGSGKSTIVRLYAEALGATTANRRFARVAVRPDWVDQADTLGYLNPVSGRFQPGWLADVLRRCSLEPDRLHFVLLDEMNLAPVEQYLAEALSAMEELRGGGSGTEVRLYADGADVANRADWPPTLRWPANLLVAGTVNIDESSRGLSDRVLDRANVLQLSASATARHHGPGQPGEPSRGSWQVAYSEWRRIVVTEPADERHDLLVNVGELLADMGIGLGIRAHVDLERFLANARGVFDEDTALDLGLLQRVVPKIRGFRRDLDKLDELYKLLASCRADRCLRVLEHWTAPGVSDDDFIDGTSPRVGMLAR